MPDTIIGNYRIIRTLGEGGMGVVYAAEHKLLGRPAAIKVLLPRYSKNQGIIDRFFNEARAAAEIKHPGIVEVYDFGYQDDGGAYIAMEFLDGEDLETRMRRLGQMPVAQALLFGSQIASALASAHERGVIHRDLKPANVFIVSDPQVVGGERIKLLDFGIAKVSLDESADESERTRAGTVLGTPSYMAPEQCVGAAHVDARADLYSLGCILFEMLCGRPPFQGPTSMDVMKAQMRTPPPRPRELRSDMNVELESVILKLLAKDPGERFQGASELEAALRKLLPQGPSFGGLTRTGAPAARARTPLWRRMLVPLTAVVVLAGGVAFGIMARQRKAGHSPAAPAAASMEPREPVERKPPEPPKVAPPLVFCPADAAACEVPAGQGEVVTWTLRSRPDRAQVMYKGEKKGETPIVIKVAKDGERKETVRLRLYDHVDEDIELSAAGDQEEIVALARNIKIAIFSKPEGAVIYDEKSGEGIGVTPGEIGVAYSEEPVRFVLRHPGYGDEIIEVVPDEDQKKKVTLDKLVTLRVESEPQGALVFKDGQEAGKTPYEEEVARGRDALVYEVKHAGYEDARVELMPRRDQKKRVVLKPSKSPSEEGP